MPASPGDGQHLCGMLCTCVLYACYAWEERDVGEWGGLEAPGYFNRIQLVRRPLEQEDRSSQSHWRTVVCDPEMEAKVGESPCSELASAALALPWPETRSPPAGDPSQEPEELFDQAPDQEELGETDTEEQPESEPKSSSKAMKAAIGATVGVGVAVIGAPVAIWAAGFTGAGIAAGSLAAKMMSAAAIANGGGVAAGSLVAALQSAGAVGLSVGAKVGLGTVLRSVGAAVGSWFSKNE
ncbi:uncharacterized protein LOC125624887 isoform X1 [Caretta caretta]|uniref:uncharacterized protein LOC125624887 isoform X1 n=2 Tax=Caretta caretta TaxID=8467 RepID=UPI003F4B79FF